MSVSWWRDVECVLCGFAFSVPFVFSRPGEQHRRQSPPMASQGACRRSVGEAAGPFWGVRRRVCGCGVWERGRGCCLAPSSWTSLSPQGSHQMMLPVLLLSSMKPTCELMSDSLHFHVWGLRHPALARRPPHRHHTLANTHTHTKHCPWGMCEPDGDRRPCKDDEEKGKDQGLWGESGCVVWESDERVLVA